MDRVLARRDLTPREQAFWSLVEASSNPDEASRRAATVAAEQVLAADGVYLASMVIALFKFYNAFVDLNGVAPLTVEGYEASGQRLAASGYAAPPR